MLLQLSAPPDPFLLIDIRWVHQNQQCQAPPHTLYITHPGQHSGIGMVLNSTVILMNSQDGEALSGFWALYFSSSCNVFIQMKQLNHFRETLHVHERRGRKISKYNQGYPWFSTS